MSSGSGFAIFKFLGTLPVQKSSSEKIEIPDPRIHATRNFVIEDNRITKNRLIPELGVYYTAIPVGVVSIVITVQF